MKIRSKYILLLFMGIIVLLLGGIFFTVQQEKEGPITAEAASVYWGSQSIPTTCPSCGEANADLRLGSYSSSTSCEITLNHYVNNPGGGGGSFVRCRTTIILHSPVSVPKREPTCTTNGNWAYTYCGKCHAYATSVTTIPALGHDYGDWFVAQAATCTQNGTEQRQCSRCSARETRTIEATGHTWDSGTVTVSATCQRTGTRKYECTACGETKTETIAKRSHNYNIYLSRVEPTCTASGRTAGYECQWCYSNTCSTIPALGHDLEYHDGQPATCTEIGWNDYETCSRCDYTTYREIAATGHTPGAAATCTTPQTCTECGAILVEALGHKTVSHLGQDPTCTAEGWKPYETCENCDYTTYEIIPALGHSFTSYVSDNNATCTVDGTETAKCDRCEVTDTRTDEGSALGHDWAEEWTTDGTAHWHECGRCDEINDKASHSGGTATCTNPAECEVCGAEYGEALGHDLEHHEAKPATCTEIGWEAYDTCTRCDYTTYVEIPAKGHTFGPDATCTEDQVCLECGEVISAATGHIPGPDATCTENQTCSVCGEILTPALGHSFTSYISDNNATCTEDGTETAKCDRCEVTDTRTDEGSALGHDLEHHEAKPATCTEIGWNAYDTCTRCDYTTYVEIEALGHNWAEEWTTDGTAHWHKCSRCDEINDKANHSGGTATCIALAKCEICGVEYGDFAEHVYVENAEEQYLVSAATCTAKATYYKSCSVCGEAGEEIFEYGEPLGHEYGEPEWTWEGYTSATATFTCTRGCGDKQTITASGSSITNVVTTPAECETEGLRTYTAKVMFGGEEYVTTTTETIEALGHDLEHHEAQPATCIEIGWNAYDTCTRCDYTTYVEIEALGHTEGEAVRENEVPASCTAAGSYDEVVYCSVCGEELSREEKVIDALGHDLEHHEAKPATCTEIGWDAYDTCSRCDYTTYIEIEALGHTEGEAVRENEVPASCTAAGSYDEVVYCAVCGEELSRAGMTIEALGHDIVKHEGQAATCTQNGWNDYETCSRCDYTTYREIAATGHTPGTAATCTSAQRCTVCGTTLVPARGHHFVDGYCSVCGAIDGTALDNDKDDAKTDLDDIAQDAKDEIDGSDLPDDVKEDLKDKVDEIINGAKDEVEGSTDFDDIDQAVENTKDEIEDAILDAEKDDAKSDLDEIAQGAKDEVDGSDLPDDVKDDLKDKIDEIVNDAKTEIDGETSKEEVDQTVEDAQQEIEDAILNAEKDDAKSDLDKIAQSAKDEIGSSGISDEEKAELKDKVDAAIEDAKEAIDNATSKEEIENIVNDTREDIDDLLKGSLDNELAEKKDAAISDLTEIAQDAKDGIDGSDISDEEKDELKGKVDEIVNDAKDEIEGAMTPEEIDEILAEAENEIAAVTEDLKAGQLNTSTLWPWIIVAIVISAALSTLFAWRHVKKVQGKGEAVGAKSVVTIAVATILIFVVVIGITLLIFAMV